MYHCHLYFYFIGSHHKIFKLIEDIPPLDHFTHDYFESKAPYETMIAKADVIVANLHDSNVDNCCSCSFPGNEKMRT